MALANRTGARAAEPNPQTGIISPEYVLGKGLGQPVNNRAVQTGMPTSAIAAALAKIPAGGISGVTSVTAVAPLSSTGGTTPIISLTGIVAIANGGTGTTTPALIPGAGIAITGAWPNQTITNTSPSSGGTVTSVGLSLPPIFTVSGSPVTTSGTLTAVLASEPANTVLAAPDGTAGVPTFRAITPGDLGLSVFALSYFF